MSPHPNSNLTTAAITFAAVVLLLASGLSAACADRVLYSFKGRNDGAGPDGRMVLDNTGNLIGTTASGGGGTECDNGSRGCGTIFSLTPLGAETILYAFQGGNDGAFPSGLVSDAAGSVYGASAGGTNVWGNVFKFTGGIGETSLYNFTGAADGGDPVGDLVIDSAGNLYGATNVGGDMACLGGQGCGTVFLVSAEGAESTLYQFKGGNDGQQPDAGVIRDDNGSLYGTTTGGGGSSNCGSFGCGVVYKISSDGTESILHAFQAGSDGESPAASLAMDASGNLYGTTIYGGTAPNCPFGSDGCGTVFKLSGSGALTILHAFQGGSDGATPRSAVIMDNSGNLYGTTYFGGGNGCASTGNIGCGTVFKLAPNGTETVLSTFGKGGKYPAGTLLLQGHTLFGAASKGGAHRDGVVFKERK